MHQQFPLSTASTASPSAFKSASGRSKTFSFICPKISPYGLSKSRCALDNLSTGSLVLSISSCSGLCRCDCRINTISWQPQHQSDLLRLATTEQFFGLDGVGVERYFRTMLGLVHGVRILVQVLKPHVLIADSCYQFGHFHGITSHGR